jgi:hypothetical protein
MLAYSYRLTGDDWFAGEAQKCYDRIAVDGGGTLDMAPLMGEMLAGLQIAQQRGDLP